MPEIKGSPLLSQEVHASLTGANKQFMDNVRQAMANIKDGQTKKLSNNNHKAQIKKNSATGIVTVDIEPDQKSKGQKLSVAARYGKQQSTSWDFSERTTIQGESIAALDSDGDGHYEVGSFLYSVDTHQAGYKETEVRRASIQDKDDNGTVDQIDLSSRRVLDALYGSSVVYRNQQTSETVYDTDGDGQLDKSGGLFKYNSQGQPVLINRREDQSPVSNDIPPAEVLRYNTAQSESSSANSGSFSNPPSPELMKSFIRNGGPISWNEGVKNKEK